MVSPPRLDSQGQPRHSEEVEKRVMQGLAFWLMGSKEEQVKLLPEA
jgi:hypothetical protein